MSILTGALRSLWLGSQGSCCILTDRHSASNLSGYHRAHSFILADISRVCFRTKAA
jgi:hypothetical protein